MPVLQTQRYDEILNNRASLGEQMDMSASFVKKVLEAIHSESVRQQIVIMNNAKNQQAR